MKYTLDELNAMMAANGGWLDLSGTQITALPEGLTVGGSLYLSGTQITNPTEYTKLHNSVLAGYFKWADCRKRLNLSIKESMN